MIRELRIWQHEELRIREFRIRQSELRIRELKSRVHQELTIRESRIRVRGLNLLASAGAPRCCNAAPMPTLTHSHSHSHILTHEGALTLSLSHAHKNALTNTHRRVLSLDLLASAGAPRCCNAHCAMKLETKVLSWGIGNQGLGSIRN